MTASWWSIIAKPDNLPIALLVPLFAGLLFAWWRMARRNDRLLLDGGGMDAVRADMEGPRPPPNTYLGPSDSTKVHTWPYLLRIELVAALVVFFILVVWSVCVDAPLEQLADPGRTPNPSKAPWYFLGLQEMLVYFDPWVAGVALPCLIVFGLCAIPYLDANLEGSGFYCWKPRRFAITVFLAGFVVLWLCLIFVGAFFRGPGWQWYWPWEPWSLDKSGHAIRITWAAVFGIRDPLWASLFGGTWVAVYYGSAWAAWQLRRKRPAWAALGARRYAVVAFLLLTMLALPIKMALRWLFDVSYIWTTPWFNV